MRWKVYINIFSSFYGREGFIKFCSAQVWVVWKSPKKDQKGYKK